LNFLGISAQDTSENPIFYPFYGIYAIFMELWILRQTVLQTHGQGDKIEK
jgi:hypothetical protein